MPWLPQPANVRSRAVNLTGSRTGLAGQSTRVVGDTRGLAGGARRAIDDVKPDDLFRIANPTVQD